ncbi:asparaginase [candidate division KSB1 bacterium]|nr:asparaginase [candidate division KSB1 bacterium]
MPEIVAEVIRNERVESRHRGYIAVATTNGSLLASLGEVQFRTYIRSAAKPFQIMPLLTSGAVEHFQFTDKELAVIMASHNSESFHLETVKSILKKISLTVEHLKCGSHLPLHKPTAKELLIQKERLTALHNNCSGKHSGMLALAVYKKWPLATYLNQEHPVQVEIKETISRFSEVPADEIHVGVDGCSAPVFFLPVKKMALMYAKLTEGNIEPGERVFNLMSANPEMIAGSDRFDTDLMEALAGRAVSKVGAEGVRCLGIRGSAPIGIAIKIDDGSGRASAAVMLEVLAQLDLISQAELDKLSKYRKPVFKNHAGIETGFINVNFKLYF